MASLQLPVGLSHSSLAHPAVDQQLLRTELPPAAMLPSGVLTPQRRATLPASRQGSERWTSTVVYPSSSAQQTSSAQTHASSLPSYSSSFPFVFPPPVGPNPGLSAEPDASAHGCRPAVPAAPGSAAYMTSALSCVSSLPPGAVPTVSAPAFPYVVCPDGSRAPSLSRVVPIILTSPLRRKKLTTAVTRRESSHGEEATASAAKGPTPSLFSGQGRGGAAYAVSRDRTRAASAGYSGRTQGENGEGASPSRQNIVREFSSPLPSDRSPLRAASLDRFGGVQPPSSLFFVSPSAVTAERPRRAAGDGEHSARADHTETERSMAFLSSPFHRSLPSSRNSHMRGSHTRGGSGEASFAGVAPVHDPEGSLHSHSAPPSRLVAGLHISSHLSSSSSSLTGGTSSLQHPGAAAASAASFSSVLGRSEEAPAGPASMHSSFSSARALARPAAPAFLSPQKFDASLPPRSSALLSSSGGLALVVSENQKSDFAEIAPNRWAWGVRLGERAWEAYRHQMALTSHFAVTSDEVARTLLQGKYPESLQTLVSASKYNEDRREEAPQRQAREEGGGRERASPRRRGQRDGGLEGVERQQASSRRRSSSEEDRALEDKLQEISDEDSLPSQGRPGRPTPVFPGLSSVSRKGSPDENAVEEGGFLDAALSSSDEEDERRTRAPGAHAPEGDENIQADEAANQVAVERKETRWSVENLRDAAAAASRRLDVHLTMAPQLGAPVQPPLRDVVARTPLSLGAPHKARSRPSVQLRLDREAKATHRSSQERTSEGHVGSRREEAVSPSSHPTVASPHASGVPRSSSEAPLCEPASCRRPRGREDDHSLRRHFPATPQSRRSHVPHAGTAEKLPSSHISAFPRPLPLLGRGAQVSLPPPTSISSPSSRRRVPAGGLDEAAPRVTTAERTRDDEREARFSGRVEGEENLRDETYSAGGEEDGDGRREETASPESGKNAPASRTRKSGTVFGKRARPTLSTPHLPETERRRASDPGSLSDTGVSTPHDRLLSPRARPRRRSDGSLEGHRGARRKSTLLRALGEDREWGDLRTVERLQAASPSSALRAVLRSEREKKTVAFVEEEVGERRKDERGQREEEEGRRQEKRQEDRQEDDQAREDAMPSGDILEALARQRRDAEDSDELQSVSSGTSLEDYLARRNPFRVSADSEEKRRRHREPDSTLPDPHLSASRVDKAPSPSDAPSYSSPTSAIAERQLGDDAFSSPLEFEGPGEFSGDFFDAEPANGEGEDRQEAPGNSLQLAVGDEAAGRDVGCGPSPPGGALTQDAATPARLQLALPSDSSLHLRPPSPRTPLASAGAVASGEVLERPLVLPPAVASVQRGIQTSLPSSPETRASRRGRGDHGRRFGRPASARLPVVTVGARLVEEPISSTLEKQGSEGEEEGICGVDSTSPFREGGGAFAASPARSEVGSKQRRYPLRQRLPALKPWLGEYARYGYKDGEWGLVGVSRCVNQDALRTVARDVTVDGVLGAVGGREEKKRQKMLRNGRLLELAVDERQQMHRHGRPFKLADAGEEEGEGVERSGGEATGEEGVLVLPVRDAGEKKSSRRKRVRKRRREPPERQEEERGKRERRHRDEGRREEVGEREERRRGRRSSGEPERTRTSSEPAQDKAGGEAQGKGDSREGDREKKSNKKRHSKSQAEEKVSSDERETELQRGRGRGQGERTENTRTSDLTSTTYEEGQDGTRRLFTYKAVTLPSEWVWMNANAEGTLKTALLSRCGANSHTLLLRLAPGETKPPIDSGEFVHYGVVTMGSGLRVRVGEKEAVLDAEGVFFIPHHTVWSLFNASRNGEHIDVYLTFWKVQ
ncbi:hypothetical protein TGDOM2_213040 [Toxoplasma gondii GAB2-2007-GAL-DOM2]|uniref:Cupin domain-containing protein n=2 Tax=Toxoplasma gondii TaxID=5811 RepID=V4Z5T1_TOXGV|nr:hypothetical protein TGVEG_213040 [Toxoplasma gondii VEG]KFG40358.1 hypothetical protein TGDOM2_213040 [Toxoplasma gondii GAB2-2007-GAL-DOM2]CEL72788.1 TPA: hypothetical protein BN1205_035180 [Toxoplasma gondii VEG]